MATRIVNSWGLIGFARQFGKMQVGNFVSSVDGEEFASCIFTNPNDGEKKFVGFSSKLGEMTPQQIAANKDDLQVVELDSGNYYLCAKGEPGEAWQDVDLGI